MNPLYLDFYHDADGARVYRRSLEMVTCYLYFTDDVLVKYTSLKSDKGELLHQWEYRDGSERDRRDYRTMASKGWGFPAAAAPIPTDRLTTLLSDTFNPLQAHMFVQVFAERFTPIMDWIGEWYDAHPFARFVPLTDEQVDQIASFVDILTEKLETLRETLELEALTCGGVLGV